MTESAEKKESTEKKAVAERAADLFDDVLESVEAGRKAAIEAVRKFVDEVVLADQSRRKTVVDAAWPRSSSRRESSSCGASCAARAGW